jgi:Ring finger domain
VLLLVLIPIYIYFNLRARRRLLEQQRNPIELAGMITSRTLTEHDLLAFPITKYRTPLTREEREAQTQLLSPSAPTHSISTDSQINEPTNEFTTIPMPDSDSFESNTACAICLESFIEDCSVRELPCHHTFHLTCIDTWLTQKSATCPCCRVDYKTT